MNEQEGENLNEIDYTKLRKHNRYAINTACRIIDEKNNIEIHTFLTTISLGGVSFINKEILPIGTILRIEFAMPNGALVNKYIEIRRFISSVKEFQLPNNSIYLGYEHGGKFVAIHNQQSDKLDSQRHEQTTASIPEEKLHNIVLHLEFVTGRSDALHHGFTSQVGIRHVYFNTLQEVRVGDYLYCKTININDNSYSEKNMQLEVKETIKDGKIYQVRGGIIQ